jgi:hypothetical protein
MEESLAEEDEDELEDEESESAVEHEKILDGLHDRNDEDDESMTQKMDFLAVCFAAFLRDTQSSMLTFVPITAG